MAGNLSDYLENKLLEHSVGRAAFTLPTTYVALFASGPDDTGAGVEVSAADYQRVHVAASGWNPASGGSISNAVDIRWPIAGGTAAMWGAVIDVGIYDSITGGNLLWYGPLSTGATIMAGESFKLGVGDLVLSLD